MAFEGVALVDFINPTMISEVVSSFIPKLFFAILIVTIGLVIGIFIKRLINIILDKLNIEKAFKKKWAKDKLEELERKRGLNELIANLGKYFIYIISILIALDILGLTGIKPLISSIFNYIPSMVAASLIFFVGLIIAEVIGRIVGDAIEGMGGKDFAEHHRIPFTTPEFIESITKFFIILMTIVMSLDQLGISTYILNITFSVVLIIVGGAGLVFIVFLLHNSYQDLVAGPKIREFENVKYNGKDCEIEDVGPIYTTFKLEGNMKMELNSSFLESILEE
ncbi:MAG: hypothetical protein ABEK17_00195 [Candidatus Aenigmatarchaeota archaeon]